MIHTGAKTRGTIITESSVILPFFFLGCQHEALRLSRKNGTCSKLHRDINHDGIITNNERSETICQLPKTTVLRY